MATGISMGSESPPWAARTIHLMAFMVTHCSCEEPWLSCDFCDGSMELVGHVHSCALDLATIDHLGVYDLSG